MSADDRPRETILRSTRSTDVPWKVTVYDANDVVVNITADDVVFTVRDKVGGTVIHQKTNTVGEHATPAGGITHFEFADTETDTEVSTLPREQVNWIYDVRWISGANGKQKVLAAGDWFTYCWASESVQYGTTLSFYW